MDECKFYILTIFSATIVVDLLTIATTPLCIRWRYAYSRFATYSPVNVMTSHVFHSCIRREQKKSDFRAPCQRQLVALWRCDILFMTWALRLLQFTFLQLKSFLTLNRLPLWRFGGRYFLPPKCGVLWYISAHFCSYSKRCSSDPIYVRWRGDISGVT